MRTSQATRPQVPYIEETSRFSLATSTSQLPPRSRLAPWDVDIDDEREMEKMKGTTSLANYHIFYSPSPVIGRPSIKHTFIGLER
jgi:hypothetical protein